MGSLTYPFRMIHIPFFRLIQSPPPTETSQPPYVLPPATKKGPFCIKTSCDMTDNITHQHLYNFTGYDTSYDIVKETENLCLNKQTEKSSECSKVSVRIISTNDVKNCNRHIVVKNFDKNWSSIVFPK